MRVLIFHGYLLRGTGSNVYNAELAAALVALGHEVHLLAQDRTPADLPFVDAVADWDSGELKLRAVRQRDAPARCTVYRPDIGGLLPVYVADRYDGVEARPFPDLDEDEVEAYVAANVAAVREVALRAEPEAALANHLVMGPAILARALGAGPIPYAVKIHGSALEYTVKPHARFLPYAQEGLAAARGVLVGSRHVARSLWAALHDPGLPDRTRLGPPGVDVRAFAPLPPAEARSALRGLAARLDQLAAEKPDEAAESAFARDEASAARAVESLLADPTDRLVAYVGKLLRGKGVDLLLAAWPLVTRRVPAARLALVGFGGFAEPLRELCGALAAGDLDRALEVAASHELDHLSAFLAGADESYLAAARALPERIAWIGRLEHAELAGLLPACEAQVVPSTFPEAFGMVAAEAAACGALPVSAAHSGLAEVSATLAGAVPPEARELLSFELGDGAVPDIADRIVRWLEAPEGLREATRTALVEVARDRFGWEGVARGVIAAAQGDLGALPAAG